MYDPKRPDVTLVVATTEPPQGMRRHIDQVVATLPEDHVAQLAIGMVSPLAHEANYVKTKALLAARARGHRLDFEQLRILPYRANDGITGMAATIHYA